MFQNVAIGYFDVIGNFFGQHSSEMTFRWNWLDFHEIIQILPHMGLQVWHFGLLWGKYLPPLKHFKLAHKGPCMGLQPWGSEASQYGEEQENLPTLWLIKPWTCSPIAGTTFKAQGLVGEGWGLWRGVGFSQPLSCHGGVCSALGCSSRLQCLSQSVFLEVGEGPEVVQAGMSEASVVTPFAWKNCTSTCFNLIESQVNFHAMRMKFATFSLGLLWLKHCECLHTSHFNWINWDSLALNVALIYVPSVSYSLTPASVFWEVMWPSGQCTELRLIPGPSLAC